MFSFCVAYAIMSHALLFIECFLTCSFFKVKFLCMFQFTTDVTNELLWL